MGQPRPLIHLFSSFQTNITNFTTNMYVKKCPSSIRCWDSNSRPLEHEPPPITTRPGLPPGTSIFVPPLSPGCVPKNTKNQFNLSEVFAPILSSIFDLDGQFFCLSIRAENNSLIFHGNSVA